MQRSVALCSSPRRFHQGFSLVEILLVMGVIALLIIAAFLIFPRVKTQLNVKKELDFVVGAEAQVRSVFVMQDFSGVQNYYNGARDRDEQWAKSPNGWTWSIAGYDPTTGGNCSAGSCRSVWMNLYYRDSDMKEEECQALVIALSQRMPVRIYNGGQIIPTNPASAISYCSRTGTNPIFIPIFFK